MIVRDYQIVSVVLGGRDQMEPIHRLERDVNDAIDSGYMPVGGPFVVGISLMQAMCSYCEARTQEPSMVEDSEERKS